MTVDAPQPDRPVGHHRVDVCGRWKLLHRPQYLVPAAAQDPAGTATGRKLLDALHGGFHARRTEQVQADFQEALVVDVRMRIGQSRQNVFAAGVDAIVFRDAGKQGLVPGGDDSAVGVEHEYAEFTDAVRGRRIADDIVDGGVRGCGNGPEAAEGRKQAAGFVHENGSLGTDQICSKNTTKRHDEISFNIYAFQYIDMMRDFCEFVRANASCLNNNQPARAQPDTFRYGLAGDSGGQVPRTIRR